MRRNESYQELYGALVKADAEATPLPREVEHRWGLRFRGEAWAFRAGAGCSVVSARRSGYRHADIGFRIPRPSLHSRDPRHGHASR
ncbi:transcriptional regulator domain-containing protein [Xanthobacter wiegelii]|uniref:transcriptional regulator domain-containing protein n=1 Tax=Xanthobacter wiegelii TaxID=3119913 RepID=UPI00373623C7